MTYITQWQGGGAGAAGGREARMKQAIQNDLFHRDIDNTYCLVLAALRHFLNQDWSTSQHLQSVAYSDVSKPHFALLYNPSEHWLINFEIIIQKFRT